MITLLSYILFLCISFGMVLFWVNLWQLKEYRLDRFFIHLKDTQQGKHAIFSYQSLLILLGFFLFVSGIFIDIIGRNFSLIALLVLGGLFLLLIKSIFFKKIKKPVLTVKAVGICIVSILIVVSLVSLPLTDISLWLFIILLIIPFVVAFSIFLFAFPTEIYTDIYIQRAKKKRRTLRKLQVIAVSGSYGKSSTKEIVAAILSKKFNVVKTDLSNNTPFVIAKTILTKITESTDFFVVELGAYKRGEIRQLAQMVSPTISVTTAVSDQHLALYGDIDDVIASELELIKELPRNALTLLNGNSEGVVAMSIKIKHTNIVWYQTKKDKRKEHCIFAQNISVSTDGVHWEYKNNNKIIAINSPLLGIHTIENILPAIALAARFGFSDSEIKDTVRTLRPLPHTMDRVKLFPNVTAIDDTFNASPESVFSSVEYLSLSPKRKIYVLSPLIELGKMGKKRHEEIGEKLANVDYLFLTNKNFNNEIRKGIMQKNGKVKIITGTYQYLADAIREILKKGDTILFEGKEAGIVLKQLL